MLFLHSITYGAAAITSLICRASAASLVQVKDFGANPGNANMYIYVPDKVAANPAIIVAVRVSAHLWLSH